MTDLDPKSLVEAALFSSGRPLSKEELAEATGLDLKQVAQAAGELMADYKKRDTSLEIGWAGQKYGMQLRAKYAEHAKNLAQMEIPKKTLKTLALIAYHQPLKQSELVDMIGSKTYDHVHELLERGLIRARAEGVTKILTTTGAFPEYFGIKGVARDEIRTYLAEKVGLDPEAVKREKTLSSFGSHDDAGQGPSDAEAPPEGAQDEEEPRSEASDAALVSS